MKGQWRTGWQAVAMLLATAAFGAAQVNAPPPRSTMPAPGTVNYVEGQVSIDGQDLNPGSVGSTVLAPNEAIDTGQGYAEILLTPGAFLRIGHNSEVRLITAGLADSKLAVVHGSAMLEAAQFIKGTSVSVSVNGATAQIEKKGLYDFDANQQAVKVMDGKATVFENDRQTTLKKGDEVLLASNKPLKKRDFDLKAERTDPLYVWSNVRSADESAANLNAANRVADYGGWYGAGWYWDPYWASYAFVPGDGLLYSPFGWGFYSPGFAYAAPYYGYYGGGFIGRGYGGHHWAGGHWNHGTSARAFHGSGFQGGAFHSGAFHGGMSGFHAAGGFHGGGFHGGGGGFHGGGRGR